MWSGCTAIHAPIAPTGTPPVDMASSAASSVDASEPVVPPTQDVSSVDAAQSMMCAADIALAGVAGCQFYACRDAEHPCGADGYYLGFGEKYCERFLTDLAPIMSAAGQAFLAATRDCLMSYMNANIATDLSCDEVKTDALASHVDCYRDNGFCALPLTDKAALFLAVDPADRDYLSVIETGVACL
jgi:hypothetical protein